MPDGYEIPIRCGKCGPCRVIHARGWALRLIMESLHYPGAVCFLTLTYDEQSIPRTPQGVPTTRADDLSAFIKRLRKNTGSKLRYFGHTEYGESPTFRPHIHILLFGLNYMAYAPKKRWTPSLQDQKRLDENKTNWRRYNAFELEILKAWQCKGTVTVTPGDENRINYVSEHQLKGLIDTRKLKTGQEPQKARMSRNPPLGHRAAINLANQMKKYGIYPDDMGAELVTDKEITEIRLVSANYQKSSTPGAANSFGGTAKSKRKKAGYPMPRTLKKHMVDALGGDKRDPYDKEREMYQRLTVGDGPEDPIRKQQVERLQQNILKRKLERRDAL